MKKVTKYISRKTLIYKTGVEYGDYTMNHVLGCSHGCKYPCYAYLQKKRFGNVDSYEEWCTPALVKNTLELLDAELPKFKNKIETLHLCFTTDPFMYEYDEIQEMSIKAIKKINNAGVKCSVLTKGILPIALSELSKDNEYGITIVSLDESFRERIEPGAAPILERLSALKALHGAGCKTWVSIEPYPTPNIICQDLSAVLESVAFADKIIFGRTNYSKEISSYKKHKQFYNDCVKEVIEFCEKHNKVYHIKEGTITEI
ncbi:MAG: radical SAM protein [Oscillospiraceae bacterium]|nr:radical SAM protein [Oscillospiraceae bacterium]